MRGLMGMILATIVAPSVFMEFLVLAQFFIAPSTIGHFLPAIVAAPIMATAFGGLNAAVFMGFALFVAHLIAGRSVIFSIAGATAGLAHFYCGWLIHHHGWAPGRGVPGPVTWFWFGFSDAAIRVPWWFLLIANIVAGWAAGSVYWRIVRRREPPVIRIDPQAS